jgi:peptidoglycan-associated lipoprotein
MRFRSMVAMGTVTLVSACGADPGAVPKSFDDAPPVHPGSLRPDTPVRDDPDQSNVAISRAIRRACSIADSDAFFSYDSANARDRDRAILKQLADCFTTGPLKGRTIELAGYADPRGRFEHDSLLGQWRADNVKVALINAGANSGQIATTSRGEDKSNGPPTTGSRRVDVLLGK